MPTPLRNDGSADEPFRYLPPNLSWQPKGMVKQKTRAEMARDAVAARKDDEATMLMPPIEAGYDEGDGDGQGLTARASTPDNFSW